MNQLKQRVLNQDWKKNLFCFFVIWLGLNIFQALFTEVMSDEAYYFLYGENLAWGYFDHPPMVGLMTYISNLIASGNLSVRLVTIFMQTITVFLIWKLIDEKLPSSKKVTLFGTICISMVMLQAYGFVTTPDVPLLFFSTIFLYGYRRFLKNESWLNTAILCLSMAGMVYSKYQSILVIGFIVLSNLKLLTKYKFWLAGIFALVLLTPHILWQVDNDYPSLTYHLKSRSKTFHWDYFFEYLPNQLVVFNPFSFGAVVYILCKYRPKDLFEKGLFFLIIGFFVFFWITCIRGHVEPHWTVAITIPMIYLLYKYSLINKKLLSFVKLWITPSIFLIFLLRILLVIPPLAKIFNFGGAKEQSKAIEVIAKNIPVISDGSFQDPSNYHFFTGKEAAVLSGVNSRQTQFDIWQKELEFQGRTVFINKQDERSTEYIINGQKFDGYFIYNFQSVNRLNIKYKLSQMTWHVGDTIDIDFEMTNPTKFSVNFKHEECPVTMKAVFTSGHIMERFCDVILNDSITKMEARSSISGHLKTVVPELAPGKYQFTLSLDNTICPAQNSIYTKVKVKN